MDFFALYLHYLSFLKAICHNALYKKAHHILVKALLAVNNESLLAERVPANHNTVVPPVPGKPVLEKSSRRAIFHLNIHVCIQKKSPQTWTVKAHPVIYTAPATGQVMSCSSIHSFKSNKKPTIMCRRRVVYQVQLFQGQISKELKTPATLVLYRATLLFLLVAFNQGHHEACYKQHLILVGTRIKKIKVKTSKRKPTRHIHASANGELDSGQLLSKAPFRYEFQIIRSEWSPICLFTHAAHNRRLSVYDVYHTCWRYSAWFGARFDVYRLVTMTVFATSMLNLFGRIHNVSKKGGK